MSKGQRVTQRRNFPQEILDERQRIWRKYGFDQHKSLRDWAKVILKQGGDLYFTVFDEKQRFSPEEQRKQIVQIAAACEEALNQLG